MREKEIIVAEIEKIITEEIRPFVKRDGGDVVYKDFEDGIVYVQLRGACAGCPGAAMTLKMGVEARLKEVIPEVKEVVNVKD